MATAAINAMMNATIASSMSVKPRIFRPRARDDAARTASLLEVPVANDGIAAFAAFLAVGAERIEVVLLAVSSGVDVLVRVAPRILADALDVATLAPVAHRRIFRTLHECRETKIGARIFEVVELVHRERGLDALDVALDLGHLGLLDVAEHIRQDERRQQ